MHQLTHHVYRAGGGHSFSSGGHSSSSSHSSSGFRSTGTSGVGGSSGGGGAGVLVLIIFVVIIVVIWLLIRKARGKGGLATPPPDAATTVQAAAPPPPPPTPDQVQEGLAAIKAHDPGFEETRFINDAERAFFTVQQAWTELKPDMSRRVMADGIWQQHRVQIEGYESAHKRNVLEGLAIANASIISASSDATYDTIVLRLLAGCADYDIDVTNDKIVRGNKDFTQWTEDWCFQRSSEATTKTEGGTMAARCPNCGAPLDLDLQGVCKYCHEAVMSGKYDWVLTRIEQVLNGSDGGGYSY
jgi:predicted lipid-binding transport protein (Tim44 family)